MKILVFLILATVAIYMFPQVYEGVGTPCHALESKAMRVNAGSGSQNTILGSMALSLTNGQLGREMAADQYPDLPERLACVATYFDFPEDWRRN